MSYTKLPSQHDMADRDCKDISGRTVCEKLLNEKRINIA